jgi:hypothetical protein
MMGKNSEPSAPESNTSESGDSTYDVETSITDTGTTLGEKTADGSSLFMERLSAALSKRKRLTHRLVCGENSKRFARDTTSSRKPKQQFSFQFGKGKLAFSIQIRDSKVLETLLCSLPPSLADHSWGYI